MIPTRRSFLMACGLSGFVPFASAPAHAQEVPLQIGSASVAFNRTDPASRTVGRLAWRGGIVFSAAAPEFGGWSDLHVSEDGTTLFAVSEEGSWFTAAIEYNSHGNLIGLKDGRIGPLHGLNGKAVVGRTWTTAHGMAQLKDGAWLVAFTRNHRIWRYSPLGGTPVAVESPPEMSRQPATAGIKALTAMPDGSLVALSEDYSRKPGTVAGWIGRPAGGTRYTWQTFDYVVSPEFRPSSMAALPDGSLATLERVIDVKSGARGRLLHVEADELRAGATVEADELATLASPNPIDNFEGLSAIRGPRGETLLWVNSNDNFNPLQRNLLLLFELVTT